MDLNISVRVEDDGLLLNDWELVSGDGTNSITVDDKQVAGEYQLIGNAANFNKTITVRNEDGSKKGELSLDMEEPLELRNMSLMLKLDEETNIVSVIVDSEYSESTDREKQETQIKLPDTAFAGMTYGNYTITQAPDWLSIDPTTGKFSGTTGKISDTATGYGTTEVIITATKGEETKEHTIDVVVVPENIEGDGAIKDSPNANMTDLIADAVSRRDQHSSEPSLLAWMPFPQDKKLDWNYCGLDITLSRAAYGITVTDTDYIISVQGKIDLSIFDSQKSEDDRAGLQVDLSGKKYIKITTPHDFKSAKFDIVGDLTYQNLTLADGFFLKEGVISVDTENDKWAGTADIEFTYFDKALKAEYVVVKKQVDTLTLELSGLDIAVGATGFFLKSVNGGVRNFSDGDDKPSEIVAGVGLYYGKQISIGGSTYSLATIDANVTITNKNITGSGDIEVLGGLVSGNVSLTIDWKDASLTANGKVTLANLLTSQGALKIDLNGNVAFATAGVIDFSEYGLGFTMSSNVLLQFSNDNNNTNDYYAAWCTQEFCGTKQSLGVRFTLDGSWELLGTEKVKKINENDNPITYSLRRSRSIPPVTGSWDLSGVSGIVLLSAQWESGETEFLLTDGNGNTYTKEDIAKRSDMEIVESMSNDKTLVIAVKDPVEGIWSLSIANGTNVEIDANILNGKSSVAAPTLTAEAGNGRDITVTWNCPELPENAELCIYYDTDSSGNDGVLLAQIVPDENSGTYTWTVPDALAGELRFYAVLSSPDLLPAVGTYTSAIAMEAKEQLVEVDSSGWTYVAGGFYVQDAGITAGGVLEIDGGSLRGDTSVAENSEIILDEATVSGTLSLAGFMSVKSKIDAADTEIIFDLTNRSLEDDYMINDISLLSGTPTYTITVAADQIKGTYKLALGASSFEGTISIKDNTTYYGTLSLTQAVTYNGNHYNLLQNGDALELIITAPSDLNVNSLTVNAEETAEQTFTVTVAFSITNLGCEAAESVVYIYDGETKLGEVNVSALADGATFDGTYTIAAGILSAGTHNITVVADGSDIIAEGDENNNSMSTYVTLVQGEVKDFAEPNDSLATAYDLGTVRDSVLLEDLSIHTGDKDYFKFTIAAEDQYTFTTMGTAGDTVLYLYDAEGCPLMSDDDSGNGYFSSITTPLSAGTYYLKVNCYTEIDTIENYSLSCFVTGVFPGISNLTYQDGTCSWSNPGSAAGNVIEFSTDNFETAAQITLYDTGVDLYGLPAGTWQWQVGLTNSDERQIGTDIVSSTTENNAPQHFNAAWDYSNFDLFFATADGVWEEAYAVQHHGAWDGG
ncbi:MAG: pre-peptidase C-terminal domain-containing protein, partial [Lentisphaeria bacterium]|nr:pre-peptidase C-terminal domain-containing protein [Lentisphaeria bacterium]